MPELRVPREADIPRLMEIRAAVRENRLRNLVIGAEDYRAYVADGRCWVAEENDIVQGFAALDAETASVWALFVDPDAEGRGVGRALHDRLVAEAGRRGLPVLTLETASETRAERFYFEAGWRRIRRDANGTLHLRLALQPQGPPQ